MIEVGTEVSLLIDIPPKGLHCGDTGVVMGIEGSTGRTRVRWDLDAPRKGFHSCGFHCEHGYGWNVEERHLSPISLNNDDFEITTDDLVGLLGV